MKPELVADYECITGECPLWHPMEKKLYWCDIPAGRLFQYDPSADTHCVVYEDDAIGGFTVQSDGSLLVFMDNLSIAVLSGDNVTKVRSGTEGDARFNDVIATPAGRVFCGAYSFDDQTGKLYRLDTDGELTAIITDVELPNGLGFSPDNKHVYFTDSYKRTIYKFDYDRSTGALSGRQVFASIPESEGLPDGLTVDSDGYVWSARWNGEKIVRYRPDGEVEREVQFPVKKVTSIAFGGPDYSTAYVTTAGQNNRDEEGQNAGALFSLELNITGRQEFTSQIDF